METRLRAKRNITDITDITKNEDKTDIVFKKHKSVYTNTSNTQSKWYVYFISCKDFKTHRQQHMQFQTNLQLLKPFINYKSISRYSSIVSPTSAIEFLDNVINIANFELLIGKVLEWWNISINELSGFTLLVLGLSSSTDIFKYNNLFTDIMNLCSNSNSNSSNACFYESKNKILPLLQTYIGMGYVFYISFDILIGRMVGFLYGGSNGYECEYYEKTMNIYVSKNKIKRLEFINNNKKTTNIIELLQFCNNDSTDNSDKPLYKYEEYSINYLVQV